LPTSFRALRIFHERAAERATHTLRERQAEGGETGRAKQNAGEAKDKTQRRRGQSKQESQKTNRGRKRTTGGAMATITKECKGKFVKWAGKVGGGVAQGVCAFPALRFAFHYLLSAVSAARPPFPPLPRAAHPSIPHFPAGITLCARLHSPIYFIKFLRAHTLSRAVGISRTQGHPIRRLQAVLLMHFKCDWAPHEETNAFT